MDTIRLRCPECGRKLSASAEKAGKRAKCPSCGASVVIALSDSVSDERAGQAWKLLFWLCVPSSLLLGFFGGCVLQRVSRDRLERRLAAPYGEKLAQADQENQELSARLEQLNREKGLLAQQLAQAEKDAAEASEGRGGLTRAPGEASKPGGERLEPGVQGTQARRGAELPSYRVVRKQDISYAGCSRMMYHVLIETTDPPPDETVRQIALAVWREHGTSHDEFSVWCYLLGMDTSGRAYAGAHFVGTALKDFSVTEMIREGLKKPASVPRLSLEKRRQIFFEFFDAEDKADWDAHRMFPNDLMRALGKQNELRERYLQEVRRKYGITRDEDWAITLEGITKGWPTPESRLWAGRP